MSLHPQEINYTETWNRLGNILDRVIVLDEVSKNEWNECFNDIYYMCIAIPKPFDVELYQSTKLFFKNHLLQLKDLIQKDGNENLLNNYYKYWQRYNKGIHHLNTLYMYFNNQHVKTNKLPDFEAMFPLEESVSFELDEKDDDDDRLEIKNLGLHLWKHKIIIPLLKNILEQLLNEFREQEYNISKSPFSEAIVEIINSFIVVQKVRSCYRFELYKNFEGAYLEQSSECFKRNAARLILKGSIPEYLIEVLKIFKLEEIKSNKFLHSITHPKAMELCYQHMIGDYLNILHSECVILMKEERLNDLRNMYLLLCKVKNALNPLVDIFSEHIKQNGLIVIESIQERPIYVHIFEKLFDLLEKYKSIVVDVFKDDKYFSNALQKTFTEIINHKFKEDQQSKSPEYLSQYFDYLLKKPNKGFNEKEMDYKLSQCITLFRYVDDKDIFQKLYQRNLAKRLIYQQSLSMDAEEGMINKFKEACGHDFTNKFSRMYIDIKLSKGLNAKFHNEFLKHKDKLNFNFYIRVLQSGAWPLGQSSITFSIPKLLTPSIQYFENFYQTQFTGKNLTWLYHQSQGELKLNYLPKIYMVTMQTIQMAILLLFENKNTLKFPEICECLEITTNDQFFQKQIKCLLECKLLLVDNDNVSLNMNYHNKRTKLGISAALLNDTPQEVKRTVGSIENDRKAYLQASIVRIMKARKVLKHGQLTCEVLHQSKIFNPSIYLIKTTIEGLIEKGYLEREPNSLNSYRYIS